MKTLILLLALTLLTGWIFASVTQAGSLVMVIMSIAVVKLLLVAFQFMDLKEAHVFWQSAIVIFSALFLATIAFIQ